MNIFMIFFRQTLLMKVGLVLNHLKYTTDGNIMLQKWKYIAIQMTKISMFLGIFHSNAKKFQKTLTIAFSKLHFFSGIQSTISPKNYCCFLMRWKMRIWHQKDSLLNANSFCQRISDMFVSFSWIASQLSIFVNKQRQHKSSAAMKRQFYQFCQKYLGYTVPFLFQFICVMDMCFTLY